MGNGIKGKVVLITGGGTGIGAHAAKALAAKGAAVAVAARRKQKLDAVVDEIATAGGAAKAYVADVTDKGQITAAVDGAVRDFGRLDVLVSNAGVMPIRPLAEANTDEWDQMIDINIKGLLYGIAAALPVFGGQGNGHFINLGSVAGVKVFAPGGSVYSGTKFAVHAISEGLRAESGGKYRVTTIAPGAVESDLKYDTTGSARETVLDLYKRAISAEGIARAIIYAVEQPDDVNINEIVVRPTVQAF
jgi:NADP-dependent 3-hydroxy acid dehydrogenase YdfG